MKKLRGFQIGSFLALYFTTIWLLLVNKFSDVYVYADVLMGLHLMMDYPLQSAIILILMVIYIGCTFFILRNRPNYKDIKGIRMENTLKRAFSGMSTMWVIVLAFLFIFGKELSILSNDYFVVYFLFVWTTVTTVFLGVFLYGLRIL